MPVMARTSLVFNRMDRMVDAVPGKNGIAAGRARSLCLYGTVLSARNQGTGKAGTGRPREQGPAPAAGDLDTAVGMTHFHGFPWAEGPIMYRDYRFHRKARWRAASAPTGRGFDLLRLARRFRGHLCKRVQQLR